MNSALTEMLFAIVHAISKYFVTETKESRGRCEVIFSLIQGTWTPTEDEGETQFILSLSDRAQIHMDVSLSGSLNPSDAIESIVNCIQRDEHKLYIRQRGGPGSHPQTERTAVIPLN